MSIDTDWLADTYPLDIGPEATDAERARKQERVCLERLEALRWPDGAECPKCGEPTTKPWNNAPRGLGWRCENPNCRKRFYVLQAIPAMTRMHHDTSTWFRAAYLVTNNSGISKSALGRALGVSRSAAKSLREDIDKLIDDDMLLVAGIVGGPAGDAALQRKAKKRAKEARARLRREGRS